MYAIRSYYGLMTWTKFTILLLGAYGFYYGFNILRDYLKQPKAKATGSHQSLQLVEDVQPVVVYDSYNFV